MVGSPGEKPRALSLLLFGFRSTIFILGASGLGACATGDHAKLKSGREHFSRGEFQRAEAELYAPAVLDQKKSRLQHYLWLSSCAISEGVYEKALFYLGRSRELAIELRSDRGGFEWLSSEYKSNPVEYSYLHFFLVVSNLMLAEEGSTPAWSIPELMMSDGTLLTPAQSFPSRKFTPKEVADFRVKARAELKAWDQFLVLLKKTYPDHPFYKEDLLARILGSFVLGGSGGREERRTAELLGSQALEILNSGTSPLSLEKRAEALRDLARHLMRRAADPPSRNPEGFVVVESGIIPELKTKKVVVGLSTIFEKIEDPVLRFQLERIGLEVLFQFAPEFGLVAFSGALAGAVVGGSDDPPKSITGAIDRSFGFEISFPNLGPPVPDLPEPRLVLQSSEGNVTEFSLKTVSPLREIYSRELELRQEREWISKSVSIGLQYLSILLPAVSAYRDAVREGNLFKKLGILAGFFLAKKAIDRANAPDLRSWSLLPEIIYGGMVQVSPGTYSATLVFSEGTAEKRHSLGAVTIHPKAPFFLHRRVFDSSPRGL
ncbi:MAG: hypothetical protein KGP28_03910 [Bdellovibrionales bacterium]|nr:hypothetical protein [Bdellovibrionales bacterium]